MGFNSAFKGLMVTFFLSVSVSDANGTQNRDYTYIGALLNIYRTYGVEGRTQLPLGLRRGCEAARFLGLRVRLSPVAWTSISFECCVLLGSVLCFELITQPG